MKNRHAKFSRRKQEDANWPHLKGHGHGFGQKIFVRF